MSRRLRILHLEDDPDFPELVRALLEREGMQVEFRVVESRAAFEAALAREGYDAILADYLLGDFNGIEALHLAQERCPDTPFLLVSGTIGEQAAIEGLKAGATDYVLKLYPERLVPALNRAVREAEVRAERRRMEAELVRRERHFRMLTENALDILTILSREGHYLYNSPSVERVLGYQARELAGQEASKFVHPEDLFQARAAFEAAVREPQRTVRLEFRFRHQDGSWRYLEAVGQSHLAEPGIGGVVVNSRDVTDRKLAEEGLRQSERRFHAVWENSVEGMRLTDAAGTIVAVNEAFCRLMGVRREELDGESFACVYAEVEQPERMVQEYRKEFENRWAGKQIERQLTLRNGSVVALEKTCCFIELPGHAPLLLALFRDVTAQKRLEDQLRHSQKMEAIGQLAGGVAHDFNNILTVIHGHASLLLTGGGLAGASLRSSQQINQAAERAAGLTRQLLAFSRRQIMQLRRLDLNEVVSNMTQMLGRLLGEDIALQLQYCPHPALVQADAGMMEQVLLNLAVNARDAMPKGGLLAIHIVVQEMELRQLAQHPEAHPGRFVCLSVSDTGCGIPPENLRRVFEPFFTTKEVGKGTGLGLATVYGIIQQHQGWIEVESELGKGTSFRVFVPCGQQAGEPEEGPLPERPLQGGTETILVVEDEAPVRELVCNLLVSRGYNVLQAESGVQALAMWPECKDKVDLLLTDLVMPDRVNGRELAERLWGDRPNLKVIFTSGYSADVVGKDFVLSDGVNYLQKPYHPAKLASAVRDCLDAAQ